MFAIFCLEEHNLLDEEIQAIEEPPPPTPNEPEPTETKEVTPKKGKKKGKKK